MSKFQFVVDGTVVLSGEFNGTTAQVSAPSTPASKPATAPVPVPSAPSVLPNILDVGFLFEGKTSRHPEKLKLRVQALQKALVTLDYLKDKRGNRDGVFGPILTNAVTLFQEEHVEDCCPDGKVGARTRAALHAALNDNA